jgi:hypothetical protein
MSAVERWPEWIETYRDVTWLNGGMAVGAKARISQKRMPKLEWTVTAVEPGVSFSWETRTPGVHTLGAHTVTDAGEGRARMTLSLEQSGPGAGLVGLLVGGQTRRYVDLEAASLKRAAESA